MADPQFTVAAAERVLSAATWGVFATVCVTYFMGGRVHGVLSREPDADARTKER